MKFEIFFLKSPFFSKIFKIWNFSKKINFFMKKHTFQSHLQQSIQKIWKHPKYVENRKFHELFDCQKIFGARALPRALRARKCRIFYTNIKNNVEYSTLARSGARAEVRARQIFFDNQKAHKIFYLLHILDVLIFFELIAVAGFEMCVFS